MYIHISGWHTFCFGALGSPTVIRWGRWHSGPRWCRSWWRCTHAFASPLYLWILCCAILARKTAVRLIFLNHFRVSFYCSLHLCCDEPVETIDWLSLSLRWHVAYIVAASPNPMPRDELLYKDSVEHSSRALSRPSNTKQLKNRLKTNRQQKPKDRSHTMPWPELLPNDHSPAHAIEGINHMPSPKLGSRLCCRLSLSWLPVNRSSEGDTQSFCIVIAAGRSLIPIRSLLVPIMGCAVGVEIGGASPWRCVLPLDKRSGIPSFPF